MLRTAIWKGRDLDNVLSVPAAKGRRLPLLGQTYKGCKRGGKVNGIGEAPRNERARFKAKISN